MPVAATDLAPFTERVRPSTAGSARVLTLPTPVDRVVSFEGSFLTLPDFAANEEMVQRLAVTLLDKGTRKRGRFELAEALEDRGAQLSFSADGLRCGFSGRCLRDDLPDVLAAAAEQLREPLFDADEFIKAKARHAARLQRAMEDTGTMAHAALAQRLYGPTHPNYRSDPQEDLRALQEITVDQVRDYHASHFGARDLTVVLVGDVEPGAASSLVRQQLGDWPEPTQAGAFAEAATPQPPERLFVPVAEKQNLDVRIAHPVAIRRDHPDYLALYLGVYVLGGNFSARLMSTVRDEQGLTYGIGARLAGVAVEHDAYFLTSVTLSGENLERGIDATNDQIRRFAEGGITEAELGEKQTTLTGSFQVGLATTGGLAAALLNNAERGFDVDYLDRFPDLVRAVTVEDVNGALTRHIDPDALHTVVAGAPIRVGS